MSILKRLYHAAIHTLFPHKCLVCSHFFKPPDVTPRQSAPDGGPSGKNHRNAFPGDISRYFSPFVCPGCTAQIRCVQGPICLSCGIGFKSSQGEDRVCGDCMTAPKQFGIARAALVYDLTLMHLVHCFKYNYKIQLAQPFSVILLKALNQYWKADRFDIVMPVPLSGDRMRQRGFNQAYLLVCSWKKIAGRSGMDPPGFLINKDTLVRDRVTSPQTGLGRRARLANIKNAFNVRECSRIAEKRILLVDDVYTTGATVNECARELMGNGARSVDVLTLARAM
jgi:ComF family protein